MAAIAADCVGRRRDQRVGALQHPTHGPVRIHTPKTTVFFTKDNPVLGSHYHEKSPCLTPQHRRHC